MKTTASGVAAQIHGLPYLRRLDAVAAYVAAAPDTFEPAGAGALFEALQPSAADDFARAVDAIGRGARTPLSVYFDARLRLGAGDAAGAATAWTELFTVTPSRDPLLLLQSARAYGAAGQWDAAALQLREALSTARITRSTRVRGPVRIAGTRRAGVRRAKGALLGSSRPACSFRCWSLCFRDGSGRVIEGLRGVPSGNPRCDGGLSAFSRHRLHRADWRTSSSPRSVRRRFAGGRGHRR